MVLCYDIRVFKEVRSYCRAETPLSFLSQSQKQPLQHSTSSFVKLSNLSLSLQTIMSQSVPFFAPFQAFVHVIAHIYCTIYVAQCVDT